MTAHKTTELVSPPAKSELLFPDHPLLKHFEELHRQIEWRAWEIFSDSGLIHGHDLDDWLKAESEFLHPAPLEIEESNSEYVVRVEVPGFREKDIDLAFDDGQAIVSAQRTSESEHRKGKRIRTEQQSRTICRSFSLPSKIDPHRVRKHLRDGVLEIDLPKGPAGKNLPAAA